MEDSHDYIKTYATFYVNECDEFGYAKKIEMLNVIHHASESGIINLFKTGEIPSPLILDEMDDFDALMLEVDFIFNEAIFMDTAASIKALQGVASRSKLALSKLKVKGGFRTEDIPKRDMLLKRIEKANEKIEQFKDSGKEVAKGVGKKAIEAVKDVADKAIEAKHIASQAGEKIVGAAGKAVEFAQRNPGHTATAAVAAAAVLTAGVMAYRRFISKAGRACKDAADKASCKREFRNKGLQAQMTVLSAGKSKCFKGSNPDKCKAKIDVKIAQVKNKMKR